MLFFRNTRSLITSLLILLIPAAALVGAIWLLSLTETIVMPVVTAAIIASVTSPAVDWLRRHGVPPGAGAGPLLPALGPFAFGVFAACGDPDSPAACEPSTGVAAAGTKLPKPAPDTSPIKSLRRTAHLLNSLIKRRKTPPRARRPQRRGLPPATVSRASATSSCFLPDAFEAFGSLLEQ